MPISFSSNLQSQTAIITIASLASGSNSQGNISLGNNFLISSVSLNLVGARVRLYQNATKQAEDLSRAPGDALSKTHGVIYDCVFDDFSSNITQPVAIGIVSDAVPYTINNIGSTALSNLQITINYLRLNA